MVNDLLIRILAKSDQAQQEIGKVSGALGELGRGALRAAGAFAGIFALRDVTRFAAEALQIAATANTIEIAFRQLSRSAGISADVLLQELDRVTAGIIAQEDVLRVANMALQSGFSELAVNLPRLFEVARASAVASGQDVAYVFDTLVRGIIRGSPLLIDNANIFIKTGDAMEAYAKSIGKSVNELSALERQQALLNAVLQDADRIVQQTGVSALTAQEKIRSLGIAFHELKVAVGDSLVAAGLPDAIANLADFISATARAQQANVELRSELQNMIQMFRSLGREDLVMTAAALERVAMRFGPAFAEARPELQQLRRELQLLTRDALEFADSLAAIAARREDIAAVGQAAERAFDWTQSTRADRFREGLEKRRRLWDSWLERERQRQEREAERQRLEQERLAAAAIEAQQRAAMEAARAWEEAYARMRSQAEQALFVRMQPTALDFLLTELGRYETAPLEAVRRLDAIIQRGFDELRAHPDWAALLKIPEDVLTGSETALKAWAMQTREAVAGLARPDLIDWEAFVREFKRIQEMEALRRQTLDIAMQQLAAAGIKVTPKLEMQVASMIGADDMTLLAQTMTTQMADVFAQKNPVDGLLEAMRKRAVERMNDYEAIGRQVGVWVGDNIRFAALHAMEPFLPELARRIAPYLAKQIGALP